MDEARRLARLGYPAGTVVAADLQNAGRGRFPERIWESQPGANLLFTLRLGPEAATVAALPLRVGLALCRAVTATATEIGKELPEPARIKWPNDVFLGGRKLAGILCEAGPEGVFVGVGVNCNQRGFPPALEGRATSLALALGRDLDRWLLLGHFLSSFKAALGEASWRESVTGLLWRRGEEISFLAGLPGACDEVEGRLEGVDERGSILIRPAGEGGPLAFASGEIVPLATVAS